MDFLNSQHLTYQDGYLHPFRTPGTATYHIDILPQGIEVTRADPVYTIEVTEKGNPVGEGAQHDVVMRWDTERRAYYPEPGRISIGVNDFVLWRVETEVAAIPPYSIRGDSDGKVVFDSRSLGQHDVFTHLFMAPGRYRLHINNIVVGVITVRDHREVEPSIYARQVENDLLIRVVDGKAEPSSADIPSGQTVIWFIEQGSDVTVMARADTTEVETTGPSLSGPSAK